MPRKPKRPCSYPGCPKLTDGRFCEEHQKLENQRYEKYDRESTTGIRQPSAGTDGHGNASVTGI